MGNGVKKLQKVQFGLESVPGTAVTPKTLWRGAGGVLDDQRTLNKVEENVGLLTDTLRTNISKILGMISLASSTASFEQIQHLFAMGFGGPTVGLSDGGVGSGAIVEVTVAGGFLDSSSVIDGGSGYTGGATAILIGGGGSGGSLTLSFTGGVLDTAGINTLGSGYTSAPLVLIVPNGAGSDAIYQTDLPTTTVPTPKPYTITGGDNFETERMEYGLCTKIEISGESGAELKVTADIQGKQVQYLNNTAAPALLTPSPVEDILFQLCKIYLDDTDGEFGTTQVSNTIEGIKLTFTINWKAEFTADGVLTLTSVTFTGWSVSGELTYIHNTPVSGSGGAKAFFRNQTAKLLRLDFGGSAVTTPGTTYSNKHLIFDLPIKFSKPGLLDNKDGTSTVTMSFNGGYDFTAGTAGKVIVVLDQLFTLPV